MCGKKRRGKREGKNQNKEGRWGFKNKVKMTKETRSIKQKRIIIVRERERESKKGILETDSCRLQKC